MNEEIMTIVECEIEKDDVIVCEHCGRIIEDDDYTIVDNEPVCSDCIENYYTRCDCCDEYVLDSHTHSDNNICICEYCYDNNYVRCDGCDCLVHYDDAYEDGDYYYCNDCYHENNKGDIIHSYSYKPSPIFYGNSEDRHFGIELEVDKGGNSNYNAEKLLDIANYNAEHIYIKHDSSIDDGFEIVTHPMTLDYHICNMPWLDIINKAVLLGYRSHQTQTCGLHIHVNRNSLSEDYEKQEIIISRILFFVETHWNELVKFSRRTQSNLNRWAARHGYEKTPKEILDKAKSSGSRYTAINLNNYNTIEFRIFRGTLKYNTLIATIQLVNHICDTACRLNDNEIASLSWSEFVALISERELIQYLKERRLYVNEEINNEEDI